jgi:hypothetical protein
MLNLHLDKFDQCPEPRQQDEVVICPPGIGGDTPVRRKLFGWRCGLGVQVADAKHKDGTAFRQEQARVEAATAGLLVRQIAHLTMPPQDQPVLIDWAVGRRFRGCNTRQGESQVAGFFFDSLGEGYWHRNPGYFTLMLTVS